MAIDATHSIRIHQTGGPEVMQWEATALTAPGPGEALVRHTAVGLNFIDVYHRTGLYPLPLPTGLGVEAAGVVEAVGAGVTSVTPGDRVGYAGGSPGAYAEARLVPADRLLKLPDAIGDETAAAMLLQGLTVQYLIRRTFPVQAGQTILWHAAAGGVGLIACQWARALGVEIIGTVGSDEKAALAKQHGCTHTIVYTRENFVERVKEITDGRGVPVVYDPIGKDTFDGSLECLQPFGTLVSFGNASGMVPPFELTKLKGSLFVTRPTLFAYTAKREDLDRMAQELFAVVADGRVKIEIYRRYALRDVAAAHCDLEGRKTVGSSILLP